MNAKQAAAAKAAGYVKDGMTIGLGSGTTSAYAIELIGERVKSGLSIKAVASSLKSEDLARSNGISIFPFTDLNGLDLYIDGADEVDAGFNLIKGGGGALLREKILAYHSREFIVIVDESKIVRELGKFRLPVEILPFAASFTIHALEKISGKPRLRRSNNSDYMTDNGNLIVDCDFGSIRQPALLCGKIDSIPGVVESGLFLRSMVGKVIVGYEDGQVKLFEP